jgi:hypothetical protein
MADRIGKRVKITGGMAAFVGQTGTIVGKELDLYRIRLDFPVNVPSVGEVRDDLWESQYLRTLREPRPRSFRTAYGWAGGGSLTTKRR